MNLSILQFNEDNISTRITTGVLNHQFLLRPYKEHFYKFKDFLLLTKEFHSAPEYGELLPTVGLAVGLAFIERTARNHCPIKNTKDEVNNKNFSNERPT